MKLGLLSDAHGNVRWLRRCLQAMEQLGASQFWFLGDAVGYLPDDLSVLELLVEYAVPSLAGNHDHMLVHGSTPDHKAALYGHADAHDRLAATPHWARLGELRSEHVLDFGGRSILLVHGSPHDPLDDYCYPDSDLQRFGGLAYEAVFMGHTHRPFVRTEGDVLFVNVGSCGLPRDQGNAPSFVIYDTETGQARLCRLSLDAGEIIDAYPDMHDSVRSCLLRSARHPTGEYVEVRGHG